MKHRPNRQLLHAAAHPFDAKPTPRAWTIHNETPFTVDDVFKLPYLGRYHDEALDRYVTVYEHPGDPARVIKMGSNYRDNEFWIDEEARQITPDRRDALEIER